MKKVLIVVGMLSSLSASALTFHSATSGFKAASVPSGVALDTCQAVGDYSGGCEFTKSGKLRPVGSWDHSDKYNQGLLGTLNVKADHRILLDDNNLLTLSGTLSSGYHSKALTVDPYIEPVIELSSQIREDMFVITHATFGRIGGNVKEEKWKVTASKSGDSYDYSYATARAWTDYSGVELNNNKLIGITFVYKF